MLKRFFRDSALYGVNTVASRAVYLLLVPLYTRVFSAAELGVLEMLIIFGTLCNILVPLEISQGSVYYYSDSKDRVEKIAYASTSFWFTLGAFLAFALVAAAAAPWASAWLLNSPKWAGVFRVASASIATNGVFYLLQNHLRWQLRPRAYAAASLTFAGVSAGATAYWILMRGAGVAGVFYGNLLGGAIAIGIALAALSPRYAFRFEREKCARMLALAAPLVPSTLAAFVSLYIDRFVLKSLSGLTDVGIYGLGYRLASVVALLMAGFQAALTPLVYTRQAELETPAEIARIFRIFLALALPGILVLALAGREILAILTTPAFYPASRVIPLLSISILAMNLYVFAPGLAIRKRTGTIGWISVLTAVCSAALNCLLIPRAGIVGAAAAALATGLLNFVLFMIWSQKLYFVPHAWRRLIPAALLTVALAIGGTWFLDSLAALGTRLVGKFLLAAAGSIAVVALLLKDDGTRTRPSGEN